MKSEEDRGVLCMSEASNWETLTADELRAAAKVARASGGLYMPAAAAAWEFRADVIDGKEY